jgi:hypothetical protein
MPRSQPHGHRRGRAQAQTLPCRHARERFRGQVVVRFLARELARRPGRGKGTWAPDDGGPNVNTLFSTVQHDTACDVQFAVSP